MSITHGFDTARKPEVQALTRLTGESILRLHERASSVSWYPVLWHASELRGASVWSHLGIDLAEVALHGVYERKW